MKESRENNEEKIKLVNDYFRKNKDNIQISDIGERFIGNPDEIGDEEWYPVYVNNMSSYNKLTIFGTRFNNAIIHCQGKFILVASK